jgi:putative membrane protein
VLTDIGQIVDSPRGPWRLVRWVLAASMGTKEVRVMMGWYGPGMGAGAWLFMSLFWIALLVLVVWLVTRLLPYRHRPSASGLDSPEEILDRRFAQGEIDEETYRAQRATLAQTRGPRP